MNISYSRIASVYFYLIQDRLRFPVEDTDSQMPYSGKTERSFRHMEKCLQCNFWLCFNVKMSPAAFEQLYLFSIYINHNFTGRL